MICKIVVLIIIILLVIFHLYCSYKVDNADDTLYAQYYGKDDAFRYAMLWLLSGFVIFIMVGYFLLLF